MTAQCQVLISPIRKENSERSEMISQMLYGETCEILESSDGFSKIRMDFDKTEGWMKTSNLNEISEISEKFLITEPFGVYDLEQGRSLLSIGSEVEFPIEKSEKSDNVRENILNLSKKFMNVPYLWGGRSFFGVDAEGLVQLIFKIHEIALPRPSEKMAELGEVIDFLGESEAGDLAFFEDEEGKINHVGIMLNSYDVIHAFGKVRIDSLDSSGIYNNELKKHTHKLRFVKKVIV